MDIKKYNLSEKRYLNHVHSTLKGIPKDGKWIVVVLCRKREDLSCPSKTTPAFLFDSLHKDLMQKEILEQADRIAQEKFYPPVTRMRYLIARLSEDEYISFLDGNIKDADLKTASDSMRKMESDEDEGS